MSSPVIRLLGAVAAVSLVCGVGPWEGTVPRAFAETAPARIVSLAPSLTELVFALGLGSHLVGVTHQCNFPPQAAALPKVGTFLVPNVEAVLAARPEIVLVTPSPANQRAVEQLASLGVRVKVVNPQSVEELEESIRSVSEALGVPDRGAELAGKFAASVAATEQAVRHCGVRKVLFLVSRAPLIAAGGGTIQDEAIRFVRGANVAAKVGTGWPKVSIEFILREAPEVILDASMGSEVESDSAALEFWQRFPSLPAVQRQRVVAFPDDRILRPGPRFPEGLAALARTIHPECLGVHAVPSEIGHAP